MNKNLFLVLHYPTSTFIILIKIESEIWTELEAHGQKRGQKSSVVSFSRNVKIGYLEDYISSLHKHKKEVF